MKYTKKIQTKKQTKIKYVTRKTIAQLKKSVQTKVNKYIRERDKDLPCISCGKYVPNKEAGHYIAQGSSGYFRYNLDNLHGQCKNCNHFLHANLVEYRIALVQKIGIKRVEWLEEHRHDTKKWTREELEEITLEIDRLLKLIKSRKEEQ